jgi:hypothetical protein
MSKVRPGRMATGVQAEGRNEEYLFAFDGRNDREGLL